MKATEKAYIAGFLDGDGSIHIRLKPNKTYRFGFQIAPSIVFYQSSKESFILDYFKKILGVGYIRERKDGIHEYIIGDSESMLYFINNIFPYLKIKRRQAELFKKIISARKSIKNAKDFYSVAKKIDLFEELNYSKNRKNNSDKVKEHLLQNGLLTL